MKKPMQGSIDSQIRAQLFKKFINFDREEKKSFLKENGIVWGGMYVGQYDATTDKIKINYLVNPFNKRFLEAVPQKECVYTEEFPIIIKLWIDQKNNDPTPENIFLAEMVGGYIESAKAGQLRDALKKSKDRAARIADLEERNRQLFRDNISLSKKITAADDEQLQLQRKLENALSETQRLATALRENREHQKTVLVQDEEYTELNNRYRFVCESNRRFKEENDRLKKIIAEKNSIKDREIEITRLKTNLAECKSFNKKLVTDNKNLSIKNENLIEMLKQERSENKALARINDANWKEKANLESKLKESKKIANIIIDRNINVLLHVTRMDNLDSILKNGILPVSQLNRNAARNDLERYDRKLDCSSLSITRPNLRYFGKASQRNTGQTYICIYIKPSILLDSNIKFYCHHNAATGSISNATSKGLLTTADDFEYMFADTIEYQTIEGKQKLSRKNYHKENWATSDQAEILYEGIIAPSNFLSVAFPSERDLNASIRLLEEHDMFGMVNQALKF